ncbi:MFS transporter [Metabacillus litoralis]|uniref:MDR family MFS transporter n=1 Tax=Metabacillus litoralis TaxID=152268 RepID=UPI00203B50D1|nr:MFS transporter [Metabacillus litoralis]MCM3163855.1 MFS transporter [Metabacillus litoralis]MCM3410632.1 MFS transporter [Metabacillus litoralis]
MWKQLKDVSPVTLNILIGTLFGRLATSMCIPFLAIYLTQEKHVSPSTTGAIIAISSLVGIASSFYGGYLSDLWGRKRVLLISVFAWGLVFVGFAFTHSILGFFMMNALNGLCRSVFEPTSRAMLSDLTVEKNRLVIFNLRYTAINVGVTFGPLIGLKLGAAASTTPFIFAGITYFLYGMVLLYTLRKYNDKVNITNNNLVQLKDAVQIVRKDHIFLYSLVGLVLCITGYSQFSSTLPQYFSSSELFKNGAELFSYLLTLNAITVIVLQFPLIKIGKKYSPLVSIMIGNVVICLGLLGFAYSQELPLLIMMMIIFTIGEILMFSMTDLLIDQLAKPDLKGTYFGAMGFTQLGNVIGPWIGGILLEQFGANKPFYLFGTLVMITIVALPILLYVKYEMKKKSVAVEVAIPQ